MRLADDFYLIAHADTGQSRLHPKAAGYALAAALLAELCLLGRVTVDPKGVTVLSQQPPEDLLAHKVLDHLIAEPQRHPVRVWLAFLGRTAADDVAQRLVRAAVLERIDSWRPWGVSRKYVAVSLNDAAWPYARISGRLARREPMDLVDQVLAGLGSATGLTREMLWDDNTGLSRSYLVSVLSGLPIPLRTLVAETEVAVSKAAATRT